MPPFPCGAAEGAGSGANPWGREGDAIGAEVTRQGVGRAPLHEVTKFLLGYRARVGSWGPEWSPRGPQGAKGEVAERRANSEGQAWVFFSVLFTFSLFLSLQ